MLLTRFLCSRFIKYFSKAQSFTHPADNLFLFSLLHWFNRCLGYQNGIKMALARPIKFVCCNSPLNQSFLSPTSNNCISTHHVWKIWARYSRYIEGKGYQYYCVSRNCRRLPYKRLMLDQQNDTTHGVYLISLLNCFTVSFIADLLRRDDFSYKDLKALCDPS